MSRPASSRARLLLPAALVLVASFTSAAARADNRSDASELFRAAQAAYERGELRAAALAFAQAYEKAPNPVAKYNEGLSWQQAGDLPRAADALARVVDSADLPDAARADARRRMSDLSPRLFVLTVTAVVPGALFSIAHVSDRPGPLTTHLLPGDHVLRMRLPGGVVVERHVAATAGHAADLVLTPPVASPSVATPVTAHAKVPMAVSPLPADPPRPWLTVGWVGVAVGGAALGVGVGFGVAFKDALDDFAAHGDTSASTRSRAVTDQAVANTSLVVAAVAGAAGVTLVASSLLGGKARVQVAGARLLLGGEF